MANNGNLLWNFEYYYAKNVKKICFTIIIKSHLKYFTKKM